MSALKSNQINRNYIEKLKYKGKDWIVQNIKELENNPKEEDEIYLNALKKALKELNYV